MKSYRENKFYKNVFVLLDALDNKVNKTYGGAPRKREPPDGHQKLGGQGKWEDSCAV